jgi:hypothetical protein
VFTSDAATQGEGWTATTQGLWQGVENYSKENGVTLYPNPANDNFYLTIPEIANTNATISIVDITGREVYNTKAQFSNAGNAFINSGSLIAGIYIVKVSAPNQTTFSAKLFKK